MQTILDLKKELIDSGWWDIEERISSYGWGDGEWMRTWAEDCESAGCNLVSEPVICNEAPDDAAAESCRALGGALAAV